MTVEPELNELASESKLQGTARQVFISYSSRDGKTAKRVCDTLEKNGIPCWLASRDVPRSTDFAEAVYLGIQACQVVILVLTQASNDSKHVQRELVVADNSKKPILPFKIKKVVLSPAMELRLAVAQWLDATTRPLKPHLAQLVRDVSELLGKVPPEFPVVPRDWRTMRLWTFGILGVTIPLLAVVRVLPTPLQPPPASDRMATLQYLSQRARDPHYQQLLREQDDGWTSRPLTIGVCRLATPPGMGGESELIRTLVEQHFNQTPGLRSVEREELDRTLGEQAIGSSDLADPNLLAQLGRLRFARLFFCGTLLADHASRQVAFSLFDCGTSVIVAPEVVGGASSAEEVAAAVARTAGDNLRREYPLRGRITELADPDVYLNIGTDVGLEKGQRFLVLEDPRQRGSRSVDLRRQVGQGTVMEAGKTVAIGRLDASSAAVTKNLRFEVVPSS